jgi:hypothetical protein
MRHLVSAAVLLLAACATLPPLRPADPAQAVANERSAGTAFADGIRIVVRPGAWKGGEDLEQYLTPVEVAIHNASGRAVQVRPASFSLLVPGGFRYDALSAEDVRRALGPMRAGVYGGYGYLFAPWGTPFYGWGGPYRAWSGWNGFGPSPWWGPVVYYGGPSSGRIPTEARTQGTLEPGGHATILLFFPVPAEHLDTLALDASLSDTSGQKLAALRVPFVRRAPGAGLAVASDRSAAGSGLPQSPPARLVADRPAATARDDPAFAAAGDASAAAAAAGGHARRPAGAGARRRAATAVAAPPRATR